MKSMVEAEKERDARASVREDRLMSFLEKHYSFGQRECSNLIFQFVVNCLLHFE